MIVNVVVCEYNVILMKQRPTRPTPTYTLFPYTAHFHASSPLRVPPMPALGVRPALCGATVAQRLARRAAERADRGARRMKGLIVAIQFLTRLPTPRIAVSAGE